MKAITSALAAFSILALGACGGSEPEAANTVEDINVTADDLLADNTLEPLPADPLADANTVDLNAGVVANDSDANLGGAGNAL